MRHIIEYNPRTRPKKRKVTLQNETHQAVRSLIITLTLMIIVLGVFFLGYTNEGSQKGYALEQAKLENKYLKEVNENLKTKITNSTAFTKLEEKDEIEQMQEAQAVNYVTEEDNKI